MNIRPRRRLGVLTALVGLAGGMLAVLVPSAAYAERVPYFCDQNPVENSDSFVFTSSSEPGSGGKDWLSVFTFHYSSQTFTPGTTTNGQSSWTGNNDLGASGIPTRVIGTMTQEKVTSVTNGVTSVVTLPGVLKGLNQTGLLNRTVTDRVSFTTTLDRTFTTEPFTTESIEYGIFGLIVNYDVRVYVLHDQGDRCEFRSDKSGNVTRYLPALDGYNRTVLPRINIGGIVNPADYSYNIHNCTTVAMFGIFYPPSQVIVRQLPRQWAPIGPGTLYFYDAPRQINATLPCDMQAGAYASVAVRTIDSFGRPVESLPRTIYIYP